MFRMYILSLGTWLLVIWWESTNLSDVHTVSWDVTACDFGGKVLRFRMYMLSLRTWLLVIWWKSTNVSDVHTVSWDVTSCDLVEKYQCFGCTYCLLGSDCYWFGGKVSMFRMYILSLGTWLLVILWKNTNVSDVHTVYWDGTACDLVEKYQCFWCTYCLLWHDCLWFGGELSMFRMYILSLGTWLLVILVEKYQCFRCTYCLLDIILCDFLDKYQCFGCIYCLLGLRLCVL
jgi:hypothetical protein